jgi:hypothetical protein
VSLDTEEMPIDVVGIGVGTGSAGVSNTAGIRVSAAGVFTAASVSHCNFHTFLEVLCMGRKS